MSERKTITYIEDLNLEPQSISYLMEAPLHYEKQLLEWLTTWILLLVKNYLTHNEKQRRWGSPEPPHNQVPGSPSWRPFTHMAHFSPRSLGRFGYPYFADGETEAWRDEVTCLRPRCWEIFRFKARESVRF